MRGALESTELPWSTLALMLRLSRMRSEFLVARALADTYPTEAVFQAAFLHDPTVMEELDAFSQVVEDVRLTGMTRTARTPEDVARLTAPHLGRALESVALVAERLQCSPEDLLVTLVTL